MSTDVSTIPAKVTFGVPSLLLKETPQTATVIATVCLYLAALINGVFLFFPQIPANVKLTVGEYSASAVGFIHFICNMFGLSPTLPPDAPIVGANGPTSSGATKTTAMVIGLLLMSSAVFSQSIWKPLPLTPAADTRFSLAVVLPTDSTPNISNGKFQGFRFADPDIAFAVPDFSIYTGLGIDWVSAIANPATGKWDYNFTIGPRVYGGANLGAPTIKAIGGIGIRASFFKGWLAIGAIYCLTTKKPQATIGNPAALIPGLN